MSQRKSRRGSEAGTTAVEFALVAPVLFLLIGTLAETGAFMLIQAQLQFATDTAARQIRVGNVGPATSEQGARNQMDAGQFKQEICEKLYVSNCTAKIRIDVRSNTSFARLRDNVPNPLQNVGPQQAGDIYTEVYAPGTRGQMGSLVVTYDWRFVFPPVALLFGNVATFPRIRRLAAISIYRNEM